MKKVSILFVSALALGMTFTSCSKDEDNSTTGSVEGKWNFNKMSTDINGTNVSPEQDYDGNEAGCSKDFVEFKADGIANSADYEGTDCTLFEDEGTWVKNGNTLTVTTDGDIEVFEVESVSSTALKVKSSYTEQGMTITQHMSFTKA